MAEVYAPRKTAADGGVHHGANAPGVQANSLIQLTNLTAAAVSLALVVGVSVWGYRLVMRDVTGLPVIQRAAGEMRVRPDDPGGLLAQHQGLAVNAVAADGAAEKPADRLVLAPRPVTLTAEDQPSEPEMVAILQQGAARQDDPSGATDGADDLGAFDDPGARAGLDQAEAIASVLADLVGDTSGPIQSQTQAQVLRVSAPGGLGVSLRPKLRPRWARQPAPPSPSPEIDPDKIPPGTRVAQLGAFDDPQVARAEWTRLQSRFAPYMLGKSRVIQAAQSGGRQFWRLRAMGFTDLADARRFCSALLAEQADCIPVETK